LASPIDDLDDDEDAISLEDFIALAKQKEAASLSKCLDHATAPKELESFIEATKSEIMDVT
jgi:hypothetical protein